MWITVSACAKGSNSLSHESPYGFENSLDIPHKVFSWNKFLNLCLLMVLLVWLNWTKVNGKHLSAVMTKSHEEIVGLPWICLGDMGETRTKLNAFINNIFFFKYLVKFASEDIWFWFFPCWEIFVYWLSLLINYLSICIFFMIQS